MRRIVVATAIVGLTLVQAGPARGQDTRLELGLDAGFERVNPTESGFGSSTFTIIGIPAQWVRVGIPLDENLSLEPRIGISRISSEGESQLQGRLPVALLYHVRPDPDGPSFFFEGLGGVETITCRGRPAPPAVDSRHRSPCGSTSRLRVHAYVVEDGSTGLRVSVCAGPSPATRFA